MIMLRQDMLRLQQVLANILSNAVKFSLKGQIVIKAKSYETIEGGRRFQLKVRDQGIGIKDPALLGKMFKVLELKDNVNQNGSGFGLTISKMILEQLGGTLRIKSNSHHKLLPGPEDEGLTVIISFPDMIFQSFALSPDSQRLSPSPSDSEISVKILDTMDIHQMTQ